MAAQQEIVNKAYAADPLRVKPRLHQRKQLLQAAGKEGFERGFLMGVRIAQSQCPLCRLKEWWRARRRG